MDMFEATPLHLLHAAVVFLAGAVVGGGGGVLLAWLLRLLYEAAPGLRPPLMLLPWRTGLFTLVLYLATPTAFLTLPSGLAGLYPAVVSVLLALVLSAEALLAHWLPPRLAVRLAGLARTLAVACGPLVALVSYANAFGILHEARKLQARTFEPAMWVALAIVMGVALVLDLALGGMQMALALRPEKVEER